MISHQYPISISSILVSYHHHTSITTNEYLNVSQRYHIDITSVSQQYHNNVTNIAQRHHITITSVSQHYHNGITTISQRLIVIIASVSHRYHRSNTFFHIKQINTSSTSISHQYQYDFTSISQYPISITSVSHRGAAGDFFLHGTSRETSRATSRATSRPTSNATSRTMSRATSRATSISITTISQLNLSHTTSASLPQAQLIAYYLREPPRKKKTTNFKILLFICENTLFQFKILLFIFENSLFHSRTIDLSGKNHGSPCMNTKSYPRSTLSDKNHRSLCMNTKSYPTEPREIFHWKNSKENRTFFRIHTQ